MGRETVMGEGRDAICSGVRELLDERSGQGTTEYAILVGVQVSRGWLKLPPLLGHGADYPIPRSRTTSLILPPVTSSR